MKIPNLTNLSKTDSLTVLYFISVFLMAVSIGLGAESVAGFLFTLGLGAFIYVGARAIGSN